MEMAKTIMYIVWSLVGIASLGTMVYYASWSRKFTRELFKNDEKEA